MAGKRDKRNCKNKNSTGHRAALHPCKMRKNPLRPYRIPQRPHIQYVASYTRPVPKALPVIPAKLPVEVETNAAFPQHALSSSQSVSDYELAGRRPITQDKECCGNFQIHDFPDEPLQLWLLGQHLEAVLCQISIYNSPSSTGAVEVSAMGEELAAFVVQPGNTGTFTGTDIKKVSIRFKEGRPAYIEGKYCISTSFLIKRHPCPDECDYE
ncbi:hypothetical protein A7K91_12745 [Paenibacillus oryzae]|uniref:Endospore appendages core domain-containing protein n=1 Tax=Paenibacillus oryzae TaxID=1844972 RepID=A0A1A5YFK6_9BACL|nr:S-Ena type endospore appendage [Paenibacillus oryzae]OBR64368.1 hypothetical protein A7K91_12745 [Paenibacillus oryzae]